MLFTAFTLRKKATLMQVNHLVSGNSGIYLYIHHHTPVLQFPLKTIHSSIFDAKVTKNASLIDQTAWNNVHMTIPALH